eukprot:m.19156 g.19156  ORF g.19156 m.19156 type:complete len:62 (+) comp5404_c0_seq1:1078-1263(+)
MPLWRQVVLHDLGTQLECPDTADSLPNESPFQFFSGPSWFTFKPEVQPNFEFALSADLLTL